MRAISYEEAKAYLLAMDRPPEERSNHRIWVEHELPRFLRSLALVPDAQPGQRCLEIGSMPFTFTLLMQRCHRYDLALVDYDSSNDREYHSVVVLPDFQERHEFHSLACDIERERLPFADASFDGVLCCEVLEHLISDPLAMLSEIHRVLRPDGWLLLTTPNVANLHNILALLHGRNVFGRYELVFGPTCRHNREYTAREVGDLLTGTGFRLEHLSVEEPLPPGAKLPISQRLIQSALRTFYRQNYGRQIFALARRGPVFRADHPRWLYEHVDLHERLRSAVTAV